MDTIGGGFVIDTRTFTGAFIFPVSFASAHNLYLQLLACFCFLAVHPSVHSPLSSFPFLPMTLRMRNVSHPQRHSSFSGLRDPSITAPSPIVDGLGPLTNHMLVSSPFPTPCRFGRPTTCSPCLRCPLLARSSFIPNVPIFPPLLSLVSHSHHNDTVAILCFAGGLKKIRR